MKQPNNVRNRWRRYREAMRGYQWTATPFRKWARHSAPDSYAAIPGQPNETVKLFACRCKRQIFCTCYYKDYTL
jgi:hypothetical protein